MVASLIVTLGIGMSAAMTGGYIWFRNDSNRKCSYPDGAANFDVGKYYGRWYEINRDSLIPYETGECVTADYSSQANGNVGIKNTQYFFTGEQALQTDGVEGYAVPVQDYVGALAVKFTWIQPTQLNYIVLDTDYDTYAYVYSCASLFGGLYKLETAWLLYRTELVTTDAGYSSAYTQFTQTLSAKVPDYDQSNLRVTLQGSSNNCKYADYTAT